MSKSRWSGGRSTEVNVIDPRLRRSVRRRAGIAVFVVGVPVALVAAMVAASDLHVIVAVLLGMAVGTVGGAVVGVAVLVWPVVRVIWHWLPEITLTGGLLVGLNELAQVIPAPFAILAMALVIGGVLAIPVSRRLVVAWAWCVISRHRLRVCFSAFLAGNRDGSLPLILIARPTPVGERVWIWLRPGLSLSMLQDRVEQIAVTCWANEVTVTRASSKYAGFLRFDIKRRNTLTVTVDNPLVEGIPADVPIREATAPVPVDVTALNLRDIPAEAVTEPAAKPGGKKPATASRPESARKPAAAMAGAADAADDISDWI